MIDDEKLIMIDDEWFIGIVIYLYESSSRMGIIIPLRQGWDGKETGCLATSRW